MLRKQKDKSMKKRILPCLLMNCAELSQKLGDTNNHLKATEKCTCNITFKLSSKQRCNV